MQLSVSNVLVMVCAGDMRVRSLPSLVPADGKGQGKGPGGKVF